MRARQVQWSEVDGDAILPRRYADAPRDLKMWKLGDVVDMASGLYVSEYVAATEERSRPYLRVDNVRSFLPNLTGPDLVHVRADLVPGYQRVSVRVGDVVIARTATLGRAFVVDGSLDGAVMSQHVTRLRVRERGEDTVAPHVLAAYLNTPAGKEAVISRASGSTRLELTHHDLASVEIPAALASVLMDEALDARIASLFGEMRERVLAARARCGALAGEPLEEEGGLRIASVPFGERAFEESMLPRFHEPGWERVASILASHFQLARLGDLARVQRGAGTTSREYRDSGIPYFRTSSLVNEGIDLFPEHYGDEATYQEHGQGVGAGDVLLTIEGKIGFVALLADGERALVKNHIEVVRPTSAKLPAGFLTAWLGSWPIQRQLARYTVVQTTIPGIASASREVLVPVSGRTPSSQRLLAEVMAFAEVEVQRSLRARRSLMDEFNRLRERVLHATGQVKPASPLLEDARPDRVPKASRQVGLLKRGRQASVEEEFDRPSD